MAPPAAGVRPPTTHSLLFSPYGWEVTGQVTRATGAVGAVASLVWMMERSYSLYKNQPTWRALTIASLIAGALGSGLIDAARTRPATGRLPPEGPERWLLLGGVGTFVGTLLIGIAADHLADRLNSGWLRSALFKTSDFLLAVPGVFIMGLGALTLVYGVGRWLSRPTLASNEPSAS